MLELLYLFKFKHGRYRAAVLTAQPVSSGYRIYAILFSLVTNNFRVGMGRTRLGRGAIRTLETSEIYSSGEFT